MQTQTKLFKAHTLEDLENAINAFLDHEHDKGNCIEVYSTQLMQIGEAVKGAISMSNGQPQVQIFFIIIMFFNLQKSWQWISILLFKSTYPN